MPLAKNQGKDGQEGAIVPDIAQEKKGAADNKHSELVPDFLKNFSPAMAARQGLWALSILCCLAGIVLALIATAAGWIAIGALYEAAVIPIDGAQGSLQAIGDTLLPVSQGAQGMQEATANISVSLRSFSQASTEIGDGLDGLSSVPLIGSSLGLSGGIAKLKEAGASMSDAADAMEKIGTSANEGAAALGRATASISAAGESLDAAKKSLANGLGWMQIAVAFFGMCSCAIFGGTLLLALAYGMPRKQ